MVTREGGELRGRESENGCASASEKYGTAQARGTITHVDVLYPSSYTSQLVTCFCFSEKEYHCSPTGGEFALEPRLPEY